MDIVVFTEDSPREQIEQALVSISREAARETRLDSLGRPNVRWARMHEFLNVLLDYLEE